MYSTGSKGRGWLLGLFLSVFFSALLVRGAEYPKAERRFMDWFKKDKEPEHEGYGAGFGMYPLWKFHKFDGFSLRPVPMNLDLGYGIPPPPPTQTPPYPPQPAYGGGGSGYEAPTPPAYGGGGGYDAQQQQQQPSYGQQGGYGQSAPSPSGYGAAPPSGYGPPPPSGYGQGGYDATPIQLSYRPTPQNNYQSNNYGPPPQSYPSPELSYSPSNTVSTATLPGGGGYASSAPKVPSYATFEGSIPFSGMQGMPMSMDSNLGVGGYVKRYYDVNPEKEAQNSKPQIPEGDKKASSA